MQEHWVPFHGWFVRFPIFLGREPQKPSDLVVEVHGEALNMDISDLYQTSEEAWQAARGYLTEARDQALKDIALLSKPFRSLDGQTECIVPNEKLVEWRAEAKECLRVAEKGLSLCQ